jgi:hypothetical protein
MKFVIPGWIVKILKLSSIGIMSLLFMIGFLLYLVGDRKYHAEKRRKKQIDLEKKA